MNNMIFKVLTICFLNVSLLFAQQVVVIDTSVKYQTIKGFSASDCWTCNYTGKWADKYRDNAAKWLFSSNIKTNGTVEGIGLSMWRINLGAGTAEQGDASTIDDVSRRAECFIDAEGNYNWDKHEGQRFFWNKAREYGCNSFVLFSNSPPVSMTRNGLGTSPGDWKSNLKTDYYDDFADYLTTVSKHLIQNESLNVTYISPVNEPQYQWTGGGQEGTPWTNSEIAKLAKMLDQSITAKDLSQTKILITEAGSWNSLLSGYGHADNQIYQFFNSKSTNYIGNLPNIERAIGGHSYWTDTNNTSLQNTRIQVAAKCSDLDIECFQTEWSMLSEPPIDNFPSTYDEATYTDIALNMAKIIHSDLVDAQVVSWSYWTSMDMERWGHKNRFALLKLTPTRENDITSGGSITTFKTLWALGNYSLFIRPGFQRIELSGAANLGGLMGSAYISEDGSKVVSVYVNMGSETSVNPILKLSEDKIVVGVKKYATSSLFNLQVMPIANSESISIPARSVVTIIHSLEVASSVKSLQSNFYIIYNKRELNISGNGTYESLNVYNTAGINVFSVSNGDRRITLPSNISSGIYIVKIKSQFGVNTQKIIVE